jgi:hypothetical protein
VLLSWRFLMVFPSTLFSTIHSGHELPYSCRETWFWMNSPKIPRACFENWGTELTVVVTIDSDWLYWVLCFTTQAISTEQLVRTWVQSYKRNFAQKSVLLAESLSR